MRNVTHDVQTIYNDILAMGSRDRFRDLRYHRRAGASKRAAG